MILGIDHIIVAADSLNSITQTYEHLGLNVLRGGDHPDRGTSNVLVPLADGAYLELVAVRDRVLAAERWPRLLDALASSNRFVTFVLESDDLDADVASIRTRGLEIGDPVAGERLRPDGVRVAWRVAHPRDEHLPFLIQDVTPRETRISPPEGGIGRNLRIANVNIGVRDVPSAMARYNQLLGVDGEDGWFHLPRGTVILRDVDDIEFLELNLSADNPAELAEQWRAEDVSFRETVLEGLGLMLEPFDTGGLPLAILGRTS